MGTTVKTTKTYDGGQLWVSEKVKRDAERMSASDFIDKYAGEKRSKAEVRRVFSEISGHAYVERFKDDVKKKVGQSTPMKRIKRTYSAKPKKNTPSKKTK